MRQGLWVQRMRAETETLMHDTKRRIAVIFDFDDTLAPDATSQLLTSLGVNVQRFWPETVAPLIDAGWDPVPAYLYRILEWSRERRLREPLTREVLRSAASSLALYPGVETLFDRLRNHARAFADELELEFYAISSGLQELIDGSRIRSQFTQVWGCELHCEAESGHAVYARNVVSFTDKTRYLFQIEKGLIAPREETDPFAVNRKLSHEALRIPFEHMLYVGDGYTDVPCFSLVSGRGGVALAVVDPERKEHWGRAWGFIEEGRAMNLAATDYRPGEPTEMILKMALESICERVAPGRGTSES